MYVLTNDSNDVAILQQLQLNARLSFKKISSNLAAIGLAISERTIKNRISRMEAGGIIHGYTVILDMPKIGLPIRRVLTIKLRNIPKYGDRVKDLQDYLSKNKYIMSTSNLLGDLDFIVVAYYKSPEHALRENESIREQFHDLIEDLHVYDSRAVKRLSLNVI